jgi:hypothetical protein
VLDVITALDPRRSISCRKERNPAWDGEVVTFLEMKRGAVIIALKPPCGVLERSSIANGWPRRITAQGIAALCVGGTVVARAMVNRTVADELRDAGMTVALTFGGWVPENKSKNGKPKPSQATRVTARQTAVAA